MFPDFLFLSVTRLIGFPTSSTSLLQDPLSFTSTVIPNYKKKLMTQLYQRNPARHALLARQGGNGFGNHSGNGRIDPVPDPSTSEATGMFNAWLLPSWIFNVA